jgi:hypothetical protein
MAKKETLFWQVYLKSVTVNPLGLFPQPEALQNGN